MLAALLLLGVLPFAIMPTGDSDAITPADDPDPATEVEGVEAETGDLLDDAMDDGAADDGEVYHVNGGESLTEISNFKVGEDLVEVDLSSVSGEVIFDMAVSSDGAWVSFGLANDMTSTVEFDGLTEIPFGDIILKMTDDDTGEVFEQSLGDVFALEAEQTETTGESGASETPEPLVLPEVPGNPTEPTVSEVSDPLAEETGIVETTITGPIVDPVIDPSDPELPGAEPLTDPVVPVDPVGPTEEILGAEADLSVADLIARDSDSTTGLSGSLSSLMNSGISETVLGDLRNALGLADDGIDGTGVGDIAMDETVPVITSQSVVDVVAGGAGDDVITTGDSAAFAFGGEGDDVLTAGEGATALYGGADNDHLSALRSAAFMDGGTGDDLVTGGAGDDTLDGGEHGALTIAGDDTLDGGAGNDVLRGGLGADSLLGGDGDDVIDHHGRVEQREIATQHEFAWHIDDASDSLDGGAGDDMLIFDQNDVATGGTGDDVFWLYNDGSEGASVADVTDFEVGHDFLRVSLNPQIGENDAPEVLVEASEDGADGLVTVNGDLVAILRGAPTATVSDVFAEVQADVFA